MKNYFWPVYSIAVIFLTVIVLELHDINKKLTTKTTEITKLECSL